MRNQKHIALLVIPILLFLFLKLQHLSIRLSDTNIYFYTGFRLLHQQFLYKDIFFTNLPLFPYISSIYYLISSGNIKIFYATALLEVIVITLLIYFIVYTKTKNYIISAISSLLYMFSSIVMVTSDHQTGVFSASIFIILSYLLLEKKYFLISGIFAGISLLTKAYFLPIFLSFSLHLLFIKKDYKHFFRFLTGFISVTALVVLPFLIFARKEFITDLFYSLTREGTTKQDAILIFVKYDFILFSVFIFNLFNFKKNSLFAIISLVSIVFLFFYQGLYYIYLNFIVPFLAISFYNLWDFLMQKRPLLKTILPTILFSAIIVNIIMYATYFSNFEVIKNINSVVELIKKENPKYLYGTADITPVLAYLSKIPLLNNIIDTNPNIFRKKILNSKKLTQQAIKARAIIVVRGTCCDKLSIDNSPINEIFDKDLLLKYCKPLSSIPLNTKGKSSSINLLKCY